MLNRKGKKIRKKREILRDVEGRTEMVKHTFNQSCKSLIGRISKIYLKFNSWSFFRIDKRWESLDSKSPINFMQEK